MDAMKGFNRI